MDGAYNLLSASFPIKNVKKCIFCALFYREVYSKLISALFVIFYNMQKGLLHFFVLSREFDGVLLNATLTN